jgi:hypothetical protein
MTAVMREADAPRAASSISSSSTRFSCTGALSGWTMKTSCSRHLAWSWTSRQSLEKRLVRTGCRGTSQSDLSFYQILPPHSVDLYLAYRPRNDQHYAPEFYATRGFELYTRRASLSAGAWLRISLLLRGPAASSP